MPKCLMRRTLGQAIFGATSTAVAYRGFGCATAASIIDDEIQRMNATAYHFLIGDIQAAVVSDGQIGFPAWPTYAPDAEQRAVHEAMRRRFLEPPIYRLDSNALFLKVGAKRILIDTGWGSFDPAVGHVPSRLIEIGIDSDSIDMVILSHLHPDHVGGLIDAEGGLLYPNADVVVAAQELKQWRDGPDFGSMMIDDRFKVMFAKAARIVTSLGPRLYPMGYDEEIYAGLSLIALPGHTVGHAGIRITSGNSELIYAADAFHDQAFDLDHPGWRTFFDYDPGQAERSRRTLLDRAVADQTLLMGYHMPFPALGKIGLEQNRYVWSPERWNVIGPFRRLKEE